MTIIANAERLVDLLLDQPWHKNCEIIPNYMPPYPTKDTKPTVQVCCRNNPEHPAFLRYSRSPKQGFFWDVYGDDMQSAELAVIALSRAPAPVNVGPITFTFRLNEAVKERK